MKSSYIIVVIAVIAILSVTGLAFVNSIASVTTETTTQTQLTTQTLVSTSTTTLVPQPVISTETLPIQTTTSIESEIDTESITQFVTQTQYQTETQFVTVTASNSQTVVTQNTTSLPSSPVTFPSGRSSYLVDSYTFPYGGYLQIQFTSGERIQWSLEGNNITMTSPSDITFGTVEFPMQSGVAYNLYILSDNCGISGCGASFDVSVTLSYVS